MLNLNGIVSVEVINEINEYTDLRLHNKRKYFPILSLCGITRTQKMFILTILRDRKEIL